MKTIQIMFETQSIAACAYDWLNDHLFSPIMKKIMIIQIQ